MQADLIPSTFPRREEIEASAEMAAGQLGLHDEIENLHLVLDAPEFEEGGYWQIERGPAGIEATLYSSPRDVLTPPNYREAKDLGLDEDRLGEVDPGKVDLLRLSRWIYRNLLQLDDVLQGRIDPSSLPRGSSAAFQICWDVWTDGRLKHRLLPGFSLAERRRSFFHTFTVGGLLLPQHWALFHELWEGKVDDQDALLAVVGKLPPVL